MVDATRRVAAMYWLTVWPDAGRSWIWAAVSTPARPATVMIDDQGPVPSDRSLEVRAPGLWADLVVETPGDHWSLGVEAFGVELDDSAEASVEPWGTRTPLGFDLEWESERRLDDASHGCVVHGEILVGTDEYAVDGHGTVSFTPTLLDPGIRCSGRRHDGSWSTVDDGTGEPFFPVLFAGTDADAAFVNVTAVPWAGPTSVGWRVDVER